MEFSLPIPTLEFQGSAVYQVPILDLAGGISTAAA